MFAHFPDLWHQPKLVDITYGWSWRLCGIPSAIPLIPPSAVQTFWLNPATSKKNHKTQLHTRVCRYGARTFIHTHTPGRQSVSDFRQEKRMILPSIAAAPSRLLTQPPTQSVKASWNVMAHAQKPDFVFRRNGRVHLNRRGRQFSRLLATEVCASAVVMLDTPCCEELWRVLATHSIRQFPLHIPSLASPCAITFQLESTRRRFSVLERSGNEAITHIQLAPRPIMRGAVPPLVHLFSWQGVLLRIGTTFLLTLIGMQVINLSRRFSND